MAEKKKQTAQEIIEENISTIIFFEKVFDGYCNFNYSCDCIFGSRF